MRELFIQKYLREKGLDALQKEFSIICNDYEDRVVLNYNQIESPRFNSVCDEARGLILEKDTWNVLSHPFVRFYNWQEGVSDTTGNKQRLATLDGSIKYKKFPIENCRAEEKLDGSLLNIYFYKSQWIASTRKMAFAEGNSNNGRTFAEIFWGVAKKHDLVSKLSKNKMERYTITFELTGPENRVVTPYSTPDITLIGCRHLDDDMEELNPQELNNLSIKLGINRPRHYRVSSAKEIINMAERLGAMEEGFVLVYEQEPNHWRVKVKNPKFVAIANMRNNGNISPRRILKLIMANDHHEYLKYFECDTPYFDFVANELSALIERIKSIYRETKNIEDQKDFALTIMDKTTYNLESGVLFSIRKRGTTIEEEIYNLEEKKISKGINLREKMIKKFKLDFEN